MDFATILTLAVLITGLIWAIDALFFAKRRRARLKEGLPEKERKRLEQGPWWVEYARAFFPVLLVVLVVRSFIVEPFRIPSGSMMPTLLIGDFILVNKFAYGLRLPAINVKVLDIGEPQRGDVVVFRYPNDPSTDYIKRVIGLPGDKVGYHDKTIYINGKPVPQEWLGPYDGPEAEYMPGAVVKREHLEKVNHLILVQPWKASVEGDYTVPEGHYFVMGDNRDNSNDSRYWGTVPEENLVGKAFLIWMHWNHGDIKWYRIGQAIR
ncbi:MAG: signal peptidase I [Gammaproteobacteria bacterium]|nr:MAG: signal peptidase I [Gammaproteobacteria bacterium]